MNTYLHICCISLHSEDKKTVTRQQLENWANQQKQWSQEKSMRDTVIMLTYIFPCQRVCQSMRVCTGVSVCRVYGCVCVCVCVSCQTGPISRSMFAKALTEW